MRASFSTRTLCALCVLAVFLFISCSQNEVHPSGAAPRPPQNARESKPVAKQGAGMNEVAAPQEAPPPAAVADYRGTVELSPALSGAVPAGGALFIIARDPNNPGAPVAALRLPVSTFPAPFTLTQAHSMTGEPLSDHLEILAKFSASGAVDQKSEGDLEAKPVHGHPGEPLVLVLEKR